jgi:hypothetical protein
MRREYNESIFFSQIESKWFFDMWKTRVEGESGYQIYREATRLKPSEADIDANRLKGAEVLDEYWNTQGEES